MNKPLAGKKILFVCPDHYDFPELITGRLEYLGANVNMVIDIEGQTFFRFARIFKLDKKVLEMARANLLKASASDRFDYLFVIKGNILTPDTLDKIRTNNPGIKFIMYQWDSILNFRYDHLINSFDKVYSFDYADAATIENISFLPLFYIDYVDDGLISNQNKDIDLLAYGVYFKERYEVVLEAGKFARKNSLNACLTLYIKMLDYVKAVIREKKIFWKYLTFVPIRRAEITGMLTRARCVLDIQHPKQTGLTSRTIETLGAKCKLLTTNKNIRRESFYSDEVIRILENLNFDNHIEFIKSEYSPIQFESYSLTSFLVKVFENQ